MLRIAGIALILSSLAVAAEPDIYLPWEGGPSVYKKWTNGPNPSETHFPVAVWLQNPSRARDYRAIGINLFVGLWKGPTAEQLKALDAAGMPVLAGFAEGFEKESALRGWTMMDEPDNAQRKPEGGYGSCVVPDIILERYKKLKAADATRPVYLNLGQGVIYDAYKGRGSECARRMDHYPAYIEATDIVSYDVYPINSGYPLWWVGAGVDRLRRWSKYQKPVWNWIETSSIHGGAKPSPHEIRAQVWLSLIHGSMGIGYFCHQFKPSSDEAAPLHDNATRDALAAINKQIAELAPALNARPVANGVTVRSSNFDIPVETMLKRHGGFTYLFAIAARPNDTTATFQLRDCGDVTVTVLGEDRTIRAAGGTFRDRFSAYQVHLYKIPLKID